MKLQSVSVNESDADQQFGCDVNSALQGLKKELVTIWCLIQESTRDTHSSLHL